jgi:hypothetical protein
MLAGGMVIAAPSMVPEAAAAGSLYVSAENAMFDNKFGGAQIVEVVVLDPNRASTSESQGEPTVKVYEMKLRMAQAVDGNWYGYFADSTALPAADSADNNLDFGTAVAIARDGSGVATGDFSEASGVYNATSADVISNPPTLTPAITGVLLGQIGLSASTWPVIQTYDFTIGTFDVVLEQAGTNEVVSLDYDSSGMDDVAGMELDRLSATQGSEIHLTITDQQLNIDPTSKDVVMFDITAAATAPAVSFTVGTAAANHVYDDYKPWSNSFDDNGILLINNNTNNAGASVLTLGATLDDVTADNFMVFFEGAENSGVFYNTDDDSNASIEVNTAAKRGTTATFDYNDTAQSFLVANDFGVIDMDADSVGDTWNSGEELSVTLIDQDLNKNTASDEDLLLSATIATSLVPS